MLRKTGVLVILLVLTITAIAYATEIRKVDPSYVCMVNNTMMSKPQIPIKVENNTYFGCCMGCVKSIQDNTIDPSTGLSVRYAIDPVTNNKVDKATAVIGVLSNGKALYFENEENLNKYTGN